MIANIPLNLQVILDPRAELTIEEQMLPILYDMLMTKNTVMRVSNFPVSPQQHLLDIDHVM